MAVCVTVGAGSALLLSSTPISSCSDYILYTAVELSPVVSQSDAIQASTLVVVAWAIAWGLRVVRRAL